MEFIKSIGFPKMHKEEGEKRDFLPELFENLNEYDVQIFLEEDYGKDLGYTPQDYIQKNKNIIFTPRNEVYKKDLIVVLRAPEIDELNLINEDSTLISMLHYETRETRNNILRQKKINCYSMDSMLDDENQRIMVNYRGTSRAGSRIAFEQLKKQTNNFQNTKDKIINVTIIGMGAVSANCAKAFEEFSDEEFLSKNNGRGLIVHMIPRNITQNYENLKIIIEKSDILVDASKRPDPTKIIIRNELINYLPDYAVILDLTADPYNDSVSPAQVKAIEGIPTGTLDKFVIEIDDDLYNNLPKTVNSKNRRLVVSCNAWPGVDAKDCMKLYGRLITPFLDVILSKGPLNLNGKSKNIYERSLYRSSLDYYLNNKNN